MLGLAEGLWEIALSCEQFNQGPATLLTEMDLQIREAPGPISQELVTKVTSRGAGERVRGSRRRRQEARGLWGLFPWEEVGKRLPGLGEGTRSRSAGCVALGATCWGVRAAAFALPRDPHLRRSCPSKSLSSGPVACSSFFPPSHRSAPSWLPLHAWPES